MKDDPKYLDKKFVLNIKPKLVRDNIPNIIVNQGKRCTFSVLRGEKIIEERKKKVMEELEELKDAIESHNSLDEVEEEVADFIEIYSFYIYGEYNRYTLKRINERIRLKQKENGSFNKNYYLEKVEFLNE